MVAARMAPEVEMEKEAELAACAEVTEMVGALVEEMAAVVSAAEREAAMAAEREAEAEPTEAVVG